jgi:hypothetical protein
MLTIEMAARAATIAVRISLNPPVFAHAAAKNGSSQ